MVPHVVQRMAMPNLPLLLAELVTANQNPHHAVLATVNLHLQPVAQVKVTANLKHQPAVPHAEAMESKNLNVPGHAKLTGNFLN